MELRSRRRHSNSSGSQPPPPRDTCWEVESNEDGYAISSHSGSDSSSDSDYEDSHIDLSQEQTSRVGVSTGDDDASDSTDAIKLSSRRGKAQSRKKRESLNMKNGEGSDVDRVVKHGDNDENLLDQQQSVSLDLSGIKKKKYARKSRKKDSPPLLWELWEVEQERWIDENTSEDVDFSQTQIMTETAEAPSDLTMPLLRYQKEWLAWALKQENSAARGGILADEMGMGKTIQAIALVLAQHEIRERNYELDEPTPSSSPCSSRVLPVIKGTLVVCPVVAVTQWVSEIDRFTLKGSTTVLVYHGARRWKSGKQFSEYDFVITTYSIIESEYRKHTVPTKVKCQYCGKSFSRSKLSYHQIGFCGPHRTAKQSKQGSNMTSRSWNEELEKGFNNKKEEESRRSIKDSDPKHQEAASFLHGVKWQRIILDEAHYIKSRNSNTAKAVLALQSSYKWALSGTPIQNRVGELYSLYVATPIQYFGNDDLGKRAMTLLKHRVLKNIVLRRTKIGRAADLALPPRIVSLRRDCLDIKEQDYYESLYNESQAQFNTYVQENTLMHNYAHIFDLLTQLRQAVDHPYLVVYSQTAASRGGHVANSDTVEQTCGICHDAADDPVVTFCEHIFCKACLIEFSASLGRVSCPTCSQVLTIDLTSSKDVGDQAIKTAIKGFRSSSILNRIQLENFQTSTKIEALVCITN